jgi:tripartite-type tricarboxylate transporter receptor subunit TctC
MKVPRFLFAICLLLADAAQAQDSTDFYRGRQMRAIVSTVVGGDYDTWMRLITRHWTKHIPGNPSILVQNMPGAGGIVAANSFFHTAPRDGSAIAMIGRNLAYQALMKEDGIRFDPLKFNWIGSPEVSNRICVAMEGARVQKADDLFTKDLIVGGAGSGTAVSTTPRLISTLLGMRLKLVEGYGSASAAQLAMERGETEGICQTVGALRSWRPGWLEEGKINVLFNLERTPIPEFKAPSIFDFAKTDEQKQLLLLFSSSVELGRPIVAPPDTPADRVRLLRHSFEQVMQDRDLMGEAEKLKIDLSLVKGETLELLVKDLMKTPDVVLKKAQTLMQP